MLLLLLGVGVRQLLIHFGWYVEISLDFIQFFGVLGLILVLLEAGLDLNMSRQKLPLIKRAAASLFVLSLSVLAIAAIVHYILDQSVLVSLVYAVPLAVISSTIVNSSIHYLGEQKREFLTYESSLSDIFGILLFNFLIASQAFNLGLLAFDIVSLAASLVVSVIVSIGLIYLLAKVDLYIKAFLVFAVLLMVYSIGHIMSLPTLLTVLIFGLIINNWHNAKLRVLRRQLGADDIADATQSVKLVTAEVTFLVRTLFFTLFGYMIDISVLADTRVLLVGTLIVGVIFLIRYVYLRLFNKDHVLPELFFAPRVLVTIVLYYSIPTSLMITDLDDGVLFFVIMLTTLIMMLGSIWFTPHHATREAEEAEARRFWWRRRSHQPD